MLYRHPVAVSGLAALVLMTTACPSHLPANPSAAPAAGPSPTPPAPVPIPAASVDIRTSVQGQPLAGAHISVLLANDLSLVADGMTTDDQGQVTLPLSERLAPGTLVLVQANTDQASLSGLFLVPPPTTANPPQWLLDLASSTAARKLTSKLAEVARSTPKGATMAALIAHVERLVQDVRTALNGNITDARVAAAARKAETTPNGSSAEALANALIRYSPLRGTFVEAVTACNDQVVTNLVAGGALVAPCLWQVDNVWVTPPQLVVMGASRIQITYGDQTATLTIEQAVAALAAARATSTATDINQAYARVNTTIVTTPAAGGGGGLTVLPNLSGRAQ